MKKLCFLLCVFLLLACQKENAMISEETGGTIIFGKPIESGYTTEDNLVKSWIILDDVTYEAVYNNIESIPYVERNDTTQMEFSWITSICIHAMAVEEVLEKRVDGDFIYYTYKIKMPISYNEFDTEIYFTQERASVTVDGRSYFLPSPPIETSLAEDVKYTRPDVIKDGKVYSCTFVDLSVGISCADKTITGKTSFNVLQEK